MKWEYFKLLLDRDKCTLKRRCKINSSHITLENSAKMRVRLAVQVMVIFMYAQNYLRRNTTQILLQIFSASTASALRFYSKYFPELKGCEATADFCQWMNDMFYALNRKGENGLKPREADFEVRYNCNNHL